jgi:hypothetical protein
MRRLWLGAWIVLTVTGLVGCSLTDAPQIRLILTGEHRVPSGATETALAILVDGALIVEPGGQLTGDLYLAGGTTTVHGRLTGSVALLGGTLVVSPDALVEGDVDVVGGTLERSPQATITGTVQRVVDVPDDVVGRRGSLLDRWPSLLLELLGLGLLAALSARFLPRPVGRVADAVRRQPLVMGSIGVLSFVVALVLLVLIGFTIVLIPLALAGVLALGLVVAWGLVGLGALTGQLLQTRLRTGLSPTWFTVFSTVGLALALELLNLIPWIGGTVAILVLSVGFGAVLLTRFGRQRYVPRDPLDEAG